MHWSPCQIVLCAYGISLKWVCIYIIENEAEEDSIPLFFLKQFYWRFFAWFAFLQSSKQTFDHWKKKSKARKICLWQISDVHQNSSILPFSLHFWEISKFSNLIMNILWLVLSLRYVNDAWLKVYQVATYIKKKKEKQSLFCILRRRPKEGVPILHKTVWSFG